MNPEHDDMRSLIEEARMVFRARARAVLRTAYEHADQLSAAVGEISPDQAFAAWAAELTKALEAVEGGS